MITSHLHQKGQSEHIHVKSTLNWVQRHIISLNNRAPTRGPALNLFKDQTMNQWKQSKASHTQSSEPILLPKVRIDFADFPYLHCSKTRGFSPWGPDAVIGTIDSTGTSYNLAFKCYREKLAHSKCCCALSCLDPYLWLTQFQGPTTCYKEKRTLRQSHDN